VLRLMHARRTLGRRAGMAAGAFSALTLRRNFLQQFTHIHHMARDRRCGNHGRAH
jgi:hypothetical protein